MGQFSAMSKDIINNKIGRTLKSYDPFSSTDVYLFFCSIYLVFFLHFKPPRRCVSILCKQTLPIGYVVRESRLLSMSLFLALCLPIISLFLLSLCSMILNCLPIFNYLPLSSQIYHLLSLYHHIRRTTHYIISGDISLYIVSFSLGIQSQPHFF